MERQRRFWTTTTLFAVWPWTRTGTGKRTTTEPFVRTTTTGRRRRRTTSFSGVTMVVRTAVVFLFGERGRMWRTFGFVFPVERRWFGSGGRRRPLGGMFVGFHRSFVCCLFQFNWHVFLFTDSSFLLFLVRRTFGSFRFSSVRVFVIGWVGVFFLFVTVLVVVIFLIRWITGNLGFFVFHDNMNFRRKTWRRRSRQGMFQRRWRRWRWNSDNLWKNEIWHKSKKPTTGLWVGTACQCTHHRALWMSLVVACPFLKGKKNCKWSCLTPLVFTWISVPNKKLEMKVGHRLTVKKKGSALDREGFGSP